MARHAEQGKPVFLPMGKQPVKVADSCAGKGGWKKPMLRCNDADADTDFIWHESEPTSNWSPVAR